MKSILLLSLAVVFAAAQSVSAQVTSNSNIINSKPGISFNANARTVAGSYTVQPEDHTVLVNATSAAVTITLPAASAKKYPFVVIKKTDSSTNAVTISVAAGGTIDGTTSLILRNRYSSVILHADNTEWRWLNASALAHGIKALTAASPTVVDPDQTTSLMTLTPTGSVNVNATVTNAVKGRTYFLKILTSGTSSYTLTFNTNFKSTGTLATGTSDAKIFMLTFVYDGTNLVETSRTTAQ